MSLWTFLTGWILVMLGGCQAGCSMPFNPRTSLSAGPFGSFFSFADSKDNDIEIEDAKFNKETHEFSVKKITIRNNSSDPRRANVEQIKAYTEQVKAVSEMTVGVANALGQFAPLFMPRPPSTMTFDIPGFGSIKRETPAQPAVIQPPKPDVVVVPVNP